MFAWLNYIPIDQELHPEIPSLPYLRVGLSVVSILCIILFFIKYFRHHSSIIVSILLFYLSAATGILTGLVKADAAYVSGYAFILMIFPILPIPRIWAWTIFGISISSFFSICFIQGIDLNNLRVKYSLNDLTAISIVVVVFIYILSEIRHRSYLKSKKIEMQSAKLLEYSEKKYRMLIENTKDIIFTLDFEGNILTINNAVDKQLGYSSSQVVGKSIYEIIYYEEAEGPELEKQFLQERFKELKNKSNVKFKLKFRKKVIDEPVEMYVNLEYVELETGIEILGKANIIAEDDLLKFFKYEHQKYHFGNQIILAELMSERVTRNLKYFIKIDKIKLIRLCLREIIINAIEHGNLQINYDDKSNALLNNNYFELINERRKDPKYSNRKVLLEYAVSDSDLRVKISDDGEGFDHQSKKKSPKDEGDIGEVQHGRGIKMTKNIFNLVKYNKKGNSVALIYNFDKSPELE
jgi:PAS domain S-box-containing protein